MIVIDDDQLERRSVREVLDDHHLRLRHEHRLDEALRRNHAADVVPLIENSIMHGHMMAFRFSAGCLEEQLPDADSRSGTITRCWSGAVGRGYRVDCGDTFLIEGGKIRLKTVHYRLVES